MISKSDGFDLHLQCCFRDGRKFVFALFTLLVFILIIYGNSLNGAWHLDDEPNIVYNKYVHLETLNWKNIQKTFYGYDQKGLSRPVAYFSFGLNYYFGRLNVFGYHAVNLIIHFCSCIFLFLFVYRTLNLPLLKAEYGSSSYTVALLTTFFWAVNPVQVTAVTYIVQRMASMAGLFYIMSMYFYLMGRIDEKFWKQITFFILAAISAVLALGTKENAAMLPVSLYLYELLLIQGITREMLIKSLKYFVMPALIVGSVYLIFFADISAIIGDYSIRPFSMWERVLTETRVILFYVSLLVYPTWSRLMLNHDFMISQSLIEPWTTLAAILVILLCAGYAFAVVRKKPLISFCIIFFFLNHIIEGSFLSLELVFEHRNYIPSMFFFVPVSLFIIHALDYFSYKMSIQLMISALLCFVLIAQGHTVSMYNFIFKDPFLLWSDNIAKAPSLSRPHNNIGNILWDWGFYDDAYASYEKAYQLNRYELLPSLAAPIHNMGRYHYLKKDYTEALTHFQTAIKINPRYSKTWVNLALTQIQMNDLKGAEKTTRQALANGPDNAVLHSILSLILLKEGAYKNCMSEAWKTLAIDSESRDVERVLAEAYRRTGHYEKAVFYWEKYIERYKNDIEGSLALIELYSKTGQKANCEKTIGKAMYLKGSQSWRDVIDELSENHAMYAYTPDPVLLLRIIRNNCKNQH